MAREDNELLKIIKQIDKAIPRAEMKYKNSTIEMMESVLIEIKRIRRENINLRVAVTGLKKERDEALDRYNQIARIGKYYDGRDG